MSEIQSEAQAEDVLISAFVDAPADERAASEAENQHLDDPDDLDRAAQQGEEDQEAEKGEAKAEDESAAKAEQEALEEDEIELPGEDGKEPTRLKLKDVLEGYQQFKAIENQRADIIERAEREIMEQASGRFQQIEAVSKQTAYMVQAALQLLQPPQPPSADMLDPSSQIYNPDKYHMAYAQYQRASAQHNHAQALGQQLMRAASQAAEQAAEARETREIQKLQRAWPEFGQKDTLDKFVSDMGKEYGFTAEELDAVLTDHRQALVARDALAFRAMKAQSGSVKAKVEAKAPKLVRSKTEAKSAGAQARDSKGQFVAGTLARAKQTGSDADWANHFAALSRAGRF